MDEEFDIVNENGDKLGFAKRSEVHGNPCLIHQAVHLLVFNSENECYLQKRALHKDIQPGKWDTSVGGHVARGEDPLDALHRETGEELGIKGFIPHFCYKYLMTNEIETELIRTYSCIWDGNIYPDFVELLEGRYWTRDAIACRLGTEIFTPNFEEEWSRYQEYTNACRTN